MKREVTSAICDVILCKGVFSYQDVLNHFSEAEFVSIATYNISKKDNSLVQALNQVSEGTPVTLITNIPGRFARYQKDSTRTSARGTIRSYLRQLEFLSKAPGSKVLFNFNNHSKIVMTDRIAYIGSANFSEEHSSNYECGVVLNDPIKITEIKEMLFDQIEINSLNYLDHKVLIENIMVLNLVAENIADSKEEFFTSVHSLVEGWSFIDDKIQYDYLKNDLSKEFYDSVIENLYEYVSEIEDMIITLSGCSVCSLLKDIVSRLKDIQILLQSTPIYTAASFSTAECARSIASDLAYQYENVDALSHVAHDKATNRLEEIMVTAEDDFHLLDNYFGELVIELEKAVVALQSLSDQISDIDNT